GKGAPLVLLHGWAMHSGLWMPFLPRLIEQFRVHLIDLPGHGHSGPLAPYTLDAITAAVAAAMDSWPQPPAGRARSLGATGASTYSLAASHRAKCWRMRFGCWRPPICVAVSARFDSPRW